MFDSTTSLNNILKTFQKTLNKLDAVVQKADAERTKATEEMDKQIQIINSADNVKSKALAVRNNINKLIGE